MFNNYLKSFSGSVPSESSGARSSGLAWRTYLAALLMLLASSSGLFAQAVWTGSATTTVNTTNSVGNPLRSATASNNCTKTQFLIRANELSSAGINSARDLNAIAWYMQDAYTNSYTNLTIRVAHTTLTAMTSTFATPTFSTVFSGPFTVQGDATNYIPFSSAFAYNGADGLLFEVLYSGTVQSAGSIRTNTTVTTATVAANTSGTGALTATTGTTSSTRPTTLLFFTPPAGSAPTPVTNNFNSYTGSNLNSNNNFREGAGFFNGTSSALTTNISRWAGIVPASTTTPVYDGAWTSSTYGGSTVIGWSAFSFDRGNQLLISPRITANASSAFSFKYATTNTGVTAIQAMPAGDSVKVLISTDDVNWTLLNGYTALANGAFGTFNTLDNSLSAYNGQSIRVAIQVVNRYDVGTSWRMLVDDVSLTAPVAKDLGATSIVSPVNPYCVTSTGNVVVRVTNAGTDPVDLSVDNLSLALTIIKPDASSETINSIASSGTIAAGATSDITFSSTFDFSASGTYSFTNLTVSLPGDLNSSNDVLVSAGSINALGTTALPLNESFPTAVTPATLTLTTFSATAAAGRTTSGVRYNNFGTAQAGTITSVPFGPLEASTVAQFDYRVTPFTVGEAADMPTTSDTIYFEYSTNCGSTYIVGAKTTLGTAVDGTWYTLQLSPSLVTSLAGQNIRFRIRTQGVNTGADYYISVDNIYIGAPQPLCNSLTLPGAAATNQASRPTFTWSAPAGGPAATGYYLYLGTDGGGTSLPTDVYNALDLGNVTTFTIPGIDPALNFSTTYFWTIVPYNASGTPASLCVSNIRSFGTSDGKPQCITGSFTPTNSSTNQSLTPTLTWAAPASGETTTGYRITFGSAPNWNNVLDSFDVGNVLTYTISTSLTVNTVYRWRVVPYNAQGNPVAICNWATSFTTTTVATPNNPTLSSPAASATGLSKTDPVFTWTAPTAGNSPTGYKFYLGTDGTGSVLPTNLVNGTNVGNVLTYTYVGTLNPGTSYRWAVIATNSFGDAIATPTVRTFTTGFDPLVMNITRSTGITYSSIFETGGDTPITFSSSASLDDANSQELNLTSLGFTGFNYSGVTVTRLTVNTNGWLGLGSATVAPSTLSFTNGFTTSATGVIAPLWDDLQLKGSSGASNPAHAASIRYKVTGTAGTQVLTIEWKDVRRFQNEQASLNFQVKLYEADDRVEIVYGNMAMYNGNYSAETSAQYSYSMGLGAFTITSPVRTGQVLSQRFFNARNFRNITENNLSVGPTCNSMYAFVPSGTADTGTEAEPVVANGACADATSLNVGFGASSTSFCQTYRTLAGAQTINDCNGTTATDDAAWFVITTTAEDNYAVDIKGSPLFKPGVQVFTGADCGSLTQVTGACASSTSANIQTLNLTALPVATYYIRVYNTSTGNGDVSTTYRTSFIINTYRNVPAPGNDNCSGATTLTVNAANTAGSVAEATASVARPACTGVGATPADDDVWYKFTATSTSHRLYLTPVAGLSLAAEVWDTASCVTATSSITKRIVCRAAGLLGAIDSVTFNTTIGNNYFVRIYNPITGAPFTVSYSFDIRVATTPVNCVTRLAPTNNGQLAGLDAGSLLRWRQASGGTPPYSYQVRFGTNRNSLPLVATISDTTYTLPALTNNQRYYWSIRPTTTGGDILPATCATDSFNAVAVTCPTYLAPFNGETGISTSGTTVEWRQSNPSAGTSYKLYLGTSPNPPLVATLTDTFYNTGSVLAGYTYYWYVIPTRSGTGDQTTCSTTVRTFETAPGPLLYSVSRLTNQPYNSIDLEPAAASFAWTGNSSVDDANSDALNLTNLGFTQFNYNGGPVSQIRVSTNGFMTFATSSTSSTPGLTNDLESHTMVVAPFWDDLYLSPGRGQSGSVKYLVTGTPGSQTMTIEWIGIERFSLQGPSLNWQVKLYEADDKIEIRYGSMVMFTGGSTTTFTSSTGISSRFLDLTPSVGQTLALQQPNVVNFSNVDNGLLYRAPDCYSAYVFTPGAASYGSQTVSAPTNTTPGSAKSISVGTGIASVNYCGIGNSVERVRTSTQTELACGSGTAPDDGAWFTFTPALNATTTVSVAAGPIFTPGLQVYSGSEFSLTAVACTTTTQGQTAVVSFSATAGTQYFARVYHNATGVATVSGQDGFFTINAYAATPKPANDSCAGAELITVSSATINGSTAGATGPHGLVTSLVGTRFADDDVWYRFQATSTSTQWSVTGGDGFIPVLEIFDGASCPIDQSTVITTAQATGSGGTISGTLSTTVGSFYYLRIYHRLQGSPSNPAATFSFFVRNQPPNCVTSFGSYPSNGATQVDTVGDGVGITWTAVTAPGTVSYNVYLGTTANSLSLAGNTSSTSFTFSGLDNATTYFYSVRTLSSTNGEAVSCAVRSFTTYILPGVPVCPTVSAPTDGAAAVGTMPTISWSTSNDTVTTDYTLIVSTNADLSSPFLTVANIPSTNSGSGKAGTYTFASALANNDTFYYRVIGYNLLDVPSSGTCAIRSFATVVANDNCNSATALSTVSTCPAVPTVYTTNNSTLSAAAGAGGVGSSDDDVWFSFVADATTHVIAVNGITLQNPVIQTYSSCGTAISAYNDAAGSNETAQMNGLNIGQTYFFRVHSATAIAATRGTFTVCVLGTTIISGTQTLSGTYGSIEVPAGATLNVGAGGLTVANLSIANGGTLNTQGNVASGSRFTVAAGGSIITAHSGGLSQTVNTGSVRFNTYSISTGVNVTYDGTTGQVTGNALPSLVNNLTLNTTGTITLTTGSGVSGTLTVSDNTNFAAGSTSFTFASRATGTGRLAALGTGTVSGVNFTVQRWLPRTNGGAQIVNTGTAYQVGSGLSSSTPLSNFSANSNPLTFAASPTSGATSIWLYDELNGWTRATSGSTTLPSGFAAQVFFRQTFFNAGAVAAQTGSINTGTFNWSLNSNGSGWQLLSNPFPSSINFSSISRTDVANSFYVWNFNQRAYYGVVNGTPINPSFVTDVIPSSTGFFVQQTSEVASMSIAEAGKASGSPAPARLGQKDLFRMKVTTPDNYQDWLLVMFDKNGSATYNAENDAKKLDNEIVNISTSPVSGLRLSGNTMPEVTATSTLPVDFSTTRTGTHNFYFQDLTEMTPGVDVFLVDNYTGSVQMVTEGYSYSFDVTADPASQGANRFEYIFAKSSSNGVADVKKGLVSVYPNPNDGKEFNISVAGFGDEQLTVTITDLLGKVVFAGAVNAVDGKVSTSQLNLNLSGGVYTVNAGNSTKTVSTKLVVKQ